MKTPQSPLSSTLPRHQIKRHKPRLLFVGEAVCLAHVGRPAMLARWARDAGYDITFACGPDFADAARSEGIHPISLKTIDLEVLAERHRKCQFFYDDATLDAYVAAERKLIRRWKPDLVVGDFRLTLHVSARQENVPMLNLINAHWSPKHPCRMPAPRAGLLKYFPPEIRDGLISMALPFVFRHFAGAVDRLRIRNGLTPLKDLRRIYTAGDTCAYLDVPEIMPLPQVPSNHFYLGPLVWKPKGMGCPDLNSLNHQRPLAYVSMGSTGDERIIPAILQALEATGFNAVLTGVEPSWGEAWTRTHPTFKGRLLCSKFVEPDEVLKHAAVCICHGGSGTIYQSLNHGVPLFCFPHNPDQGLIAQALHTAGVGFTLSPDYATAQRVGKILREQFTNSGALSHGARSMSSTLGLWNSKQRWLKWLEGFSFQKALKVTSEAPVASALNAKRVLVAPNG